MAIKNITFNGYDLQTSNIITREAPHSRVNNREIENRNLGNRDGGRIVDTRLGALSISIDGTVTESSQTLLDQKIDEIKENIIPPNEADLDIDFLDGGADTRRYKATVSNIEFGERRFDINRTEFSITFLVPEGVGVDPRGGLISSLDNITADTLLITDTLSNGTHVPEPRTKISFDSTDSATELQFSNTSVSPTMTAKIKPSGGFSDGDTLEIDRQKGTVRLNGADQRYTGVIPRWILGDNKLEIIVSSNSHQYDYENRYLPRFF